MKVWDKGPWEVHAYDELGRVYIFSDDFTHDAALTVNGDFKNKRQRVAYAKYIASILNKGGKK